MFCSTFLLVLRDSPVLLTVDLYRSFSITTLLFFQCFALLFFLCCVTVLLFLCCIATVLVLLVCYSAYVSSLLFFYYFVSTVLLVCVSAVPLVLHDSTILDVALIGCLLLRLGLWVQKKKMSFYYTYKNPLQLLHISWIRFKTLLPKTIIDRMFHKKRRHFMTHFYY